MEVLNLNIESQKLALKGLCVLSPIFPTQDNIEITKEQLQLLKEEHLKRIDLSDAIYVINKDNYIGESTKKEIEYAKTLNKEIIYYI